LRVSATRDRPRPHRARRFSRRVLSSKGSREISNACSGCQKFAQSLLAAASGGPKRSEFRHDRISPPRLSAMIFPLLYLCRAWPLFCRKAS
jgi:hypothetical protein